MPDTSRRYNSFIMSKLQLNKITISNLNPEESNSVVGGTSATTWTTISIISVILSTKCATGVPHYTDRLSDRPGSQDSCTLCTPQPQPQPGNGYFEEGPVVIRETISHI